MKLPENNGPDFTPIPPGTHPAIAYRLIDLGTQQGEYKGKPKIQHKIMLSWELPTELVPDGDHAGQPFTAHQRYTYSSSEKARLRQDLESWRTKPFTDADFGNFDLQTVLGKPCLLTIVHEARDGKTYSNIKAVSGVPKGLTVPPMTNKLAYLTLDGSMLAADFDAVFNGLSQSLQDTIKKSPEYTELMKRRAGGGDNNHVGDAPPARDLDDEIPF